MLPGGTYEDLKWGAASGLAYGWGLKHRVRVLHLRCHSHAGGAAFGYHENVNADAWMH